MGRVLMARCGGTIVQGLTMPVHPWAPLAWVMSPRVVIRTLLRWWWTQRTRPFSRRHQDGSIWLCVHSAAARTDITASSSSTDDDPQNQRRLTLKLAFCCCWNLMWLYTVSTLGLRIGWSRSHRLWCHKLTTVTVTVFKKGNWFWYTSVLIPILSSYTQWAVKNRAPKLLSITLAIINWFL